VCLLALAGGLYAVDLRHIREVFPLESITPVPGMPPTLLGVMNVRGTIVPIIDIRLMLQLPHPEALLPFAVVLRHDEYQMAVLVDRSPEILTLSPEQFLPAQTDDTAEAEAAHSFVSGVIRIEEQVYQVLDVPGLIASVESEEVERETA
jgi:purine-binding chemotaxis protein CheW